MRWEFCWALCGENDQTDIELRHSAWMSTSLTVDGKGLPIDLLLIPSPVPSGFLEIVVDHLDIEQVLYVSGSPLNIFDLEEGADFFGNQNFSLEFRIHDLHEEVRIVRNPGFQNSSWCCRIQIRRRPNLVLISLGRPLPTSLWLVEDESSP